MAFAVAIGVLVLAPTTWAATKGFEGTPAPPNIESNIDQFSPSSLASAAKKLGKAPKVDASKAHGVLQVRTPLGRVAVWAAPTSDGGSCSFVGSRSGTGSTTCWPATLPHKLEYAWELQRIPNPAWGHHLDWRRAQSYPVAGRRPGKYAYMQDFSGFSELKPGLGWRGILWGYTHDGARRVEMEFSHGRRTVTLPVVEGYFLIPWGTSPITSIAALDAQGAVVGLWRGWTDLGQTTTGPSGAPCAPSASPRTGSPPPSSWRGTEARRGGRSPRVPDAPLQKSASSPAVTKRLTARPPRESVRDPSAY